MKRSNYSQQGVIRIISSLKTAEPTDKPIGGSLLFVREHPRLANALMCPYLAVVGGVWFMQHSFGYEGPFTLILSHHAGLARELIGHECGVRVRLGPAHSMHRWRCHVATEPPSEAPSLRGSVFLKKGRRKEGFVNLYGVGTWWFDGFKPPVGQRMRHLWLG